jgi:hypothetical protein
MEKGESHRAGDSREQTEPGGIRNGSDGAGSESGNQHLAFEADVENTGTFGIEAGKAGEEEGHRQPDARIEHGGEGVDEFHGLAGGSGTEPPHREQPVDLRAKYVFKTARHHDDQSLDQNNHVAGDVGSLEGKFGAALVKHAEEYGGEDYADRMGAAHERHGDADEAIARGVIENHPVL